MPLGHCLQELLLHTRGWAHASCRRTHQALLMAARNSVPTSPCQLSQINSEPWGKSAFSWTSLIRLVFPHCDHVSVRCHSAVVVGQGVPVCTCTLCISGTKHRKDGLNAGGSGHTHRPLFLKRKKKSTQTLKHTKTERQSQRGPHVPKSQIQQRPRFCQGCCILAPFGP